MEKTNMLLRKNYDTMKNYGTMEKTMVLYQKLWNFDLPWKKLWYYSTLQLTIVFFCQGIHGERHGVKYPLDGNRNPGREKESKTNNPHTNH